MTLAIIADQPAIPLADGRWFFFQVAVGLSNRMVVLRIQGSELSHDCSAFFIPATFSKAEKNGYLHSDVGTEPLS